MKTPENTSRRDFLRKTAQATKVTATGLFVVNANPGLTAETLKAGAALLMKAGNPNIAAAAEACGPLPTDGNAPTCITAETNLYGQSYFGGFYFEDKNGSGRFERAAGDMPVQGVKDRQILVEEFAFKGWGDWVQINPDSRIVHPDGRVSYEDFKEGKNSGERFVDRWTVFKIPADGGIGIGYDLKNGADRLLIQVAKGSTIDQVWAPVDDGTRSERHVCSGNCQFNCVKWIQVSRLEAGVKVNLGTAIENGQIHDKRDEATGKWVKSSVTDYIWLWDSKAKSDAHIDYNRINTPLTDALRRSEGVTSTTVFIPRDTVPYSIQVR